MARIGFVGPAYALDAVDVAAQRCVNLSIEALDEQNEPTKVVLRGTTGLKNFTTVSADAPVRGGIKAGNFALVVCGGNAYKVATDGSCTSVGSLITTQAPVSMATNGAQVLIVDGSYGYVYEIATSTLTQIVSVDFLGGDVACFIDGYFVTNEPGTQNYQISSLYDGETWNSLDFGAAEGQPDNLVSIAALNGQLWLFGESTTEVHYNSANPDFPFERVPGAVIQRGCAAKLSSATGNQTVYWLGSDRCVYRSVGYQAQKISTSAMDQAFAKYSMVSDAIGFVFVQEGHEYYVLTFPYESKTWVFDGNTSRWHERGQWSSVDDDFRRWRGNCAFSFNEQIMVGDYENGKLYTLDVDTVTDDGERIIRLRRTPHAQNGMLRLFHRSLTIVIQTGVNSESLPTTEPQAMLRWSDDGGHSFGNELWRSLGALGHYAKRIQWNRLGMSRNRVYELRIDGYMRPVISDDSIEVEAGAS